MQVRVRFAGCPRNPLRRSCVSSARNAGESAARRLPAQPSAEIVRVECAKCRRERRAPAARATLCGDRACRAREMQARAPRAGCARNPLRDRACRVREMQARAPRAGRPRNPLRRSCVWSARNAGESAICEITARPSAESVRVECAKRRRERDSCNYRGTLCGDRARRVREMQARVRRVKITARPSAEIVRAECAKCSGASCGGGS